jgi:hypothetical protein
MAHARHARRAPAAEVCLLMMLVTALPGSSRAAVRLCEAPVSSGPVTESDEQTARAAALAIWKSKALEHGEPYASWRIAADKLLKCLPRDGGGYECLASARPCTIEQAPDRRELRKNRIGI